MHASSPLTCGILSHTLNGFLFSYGGTYGRILGLHSASYLFDDGGGLWICSRFTTPLANAMSISLKLAPNAKARGPVILFLTLPRISRQAAVLHYRHRLDVYKRPEPKPVRWSASSSHSPALAKGGGIGWQQPTILERTARHFVNAFLARRAHALGVCIRLRPSNSSTHVQHFDAGTDGADGKFSELVISYLSPRFFTLLVLSGDGPTALRWSGSDGPSYATGDVREFLASDEALFREVFDMRESGGATWPARVLRLLPGAARRNEQDVGGGKTPHPLMPESWVAQGGFAVLPCALVQLQRNGQRNCSGGSPVFVGL
ncbi:hypothetical protein BGW80DRAFT_1251331 [Lactifluus volemus]|nr:hypothetical protein BGW80DRAFT_1251331 [Lactifluus volemus]